MKIRKNIYILLIAVLFTLITGCRPGQPENKPGNNSDKEKINKSKKVEKPLPPKKEVYKKSKLIKSKLGFNFQLPARWQMIRYDDYIFVQEPDKELGIYLLKISSDSPKKAISAAWQMVNPKFNLEIEKKISPPPSGEWDKVTQINYETKVADRKIVFALARGKNKVYYINLVQGKKAAFSRRGAQMSTVVSSLKVPGIKKESFKGKKAAELDDKKLKILRDHIEMVRKKLGVTGASVGIIQNGKLVFKQGFGVRKLGGKRKVTPKTLFMIGSMTKSFTSLLMAKLVDEGIMKWDSPVRKLYPDFGLADKKTVEKCRMEHTVCACTGMPRQDMEFLFEFEGKKAADRIKLLKTMQPTTDFGETFQYSNLMVSAGGFISAHQAYPKLSLDKAYNKAMRNKIFKPLGMNSTTFSFKKAKKSNHAAPHSLTFKIEPIPITYKAEKFVKSIAPAGGAWSNIEDLAKYIQLEINKGKTSDGKILISEKNLMKRREPMAKISAKKYYGLSLIINKSKGITVIGHGGATLGFSSSMIFMPESKIGLIILTNTAGSQSFIYLVYRKMLELLYDGKKLADKKLDFIVNKRKKDLDEFLKKAELNPDPNWSKQFVGVYSNPVLGEIKIKIEKKKTVLDTGEWQAKVIKVTENDGTEKLEIGPPLTGLYFLPGKKEGKQTLTLYAGQITHIFEKK
ncbi:MAG: serine hydrolase [Deltaproteobacteria bacterium]|nr:serine hydrolase [Deltaproteobacteria bacterium]